MNEDCLKLTMYFGERDRADGAFLADALVDVFERYALQTSIVMRGVEGFGLKHALQTARLLTLSEDLPIVSVAVDRRDRIEATLPEIDALTRHGLVTLERARMLTGRIGAFELPEGRHDATKLTIYCGRQERVQGRPAYLALVDLLHRRGIAGATVLLGVDGTAHGVRERARFFSTNAEVPMMIVSVGDGPRIAQVLPDLGALLERPLITLERVRLCKRDGTLLARPQELATTVDAGLGIWQKLMVYAGEQARHDGQPLSTTLIRRLREAGASGATTLRGVWGYHGDHAPHGDRFFSLRRHFPVVTAIVDRPDRIQRWWDVVDEVTAEAGLVTSEVVPAFQASGPGVQTGGLRLATLRF